MALAARLGRPQSFVSKYEKGERRLDALELIEIAEAIGCEVEGIVAELQAARRRGPPNTRPPGKRPRRTRRARPPAGDG